VINETAAKKLGLQEPVGKKIQIWNQSGTIIGVVSDFHFTSMHKAVEPLVFTRHQKWFNNITIKVKGNRIKESLTYLEKVIKSADPNYNFNYMFVDQTFESMYIKEERLNEMVTTGSAIAIIISVMGLFSLTAFSVRRRVKEIGIRKTLGASVPQILILISGKILAWMIPGMLLAFPFAWWATESWLNGFAYRIALINYWWVWILGGIIALLVGFLTIYYQSVKTANTNPVDCLKYE
jgi:ABC-type antimicrobial peptide transport system permease subunit